MTIYGLDIGNAFSVLTNGKRVWDERSIVAPLQTYLNVKGDTEGTLKHKNKIYHVGEAALRYPLRRVFAEHDKMSPTIVNDSVVLVLRLIQKAINNNPKNLDAEIRLVIQVPETLSGYKGKLIESLNDTHYWESLGKDYSTRLIVDSVFHEGFGSWYIARKTGKILPHGNTIVIDIGGGTVVSTVFENSSGQMMDSLSYPKAGVMGLVNLIKENRELVSKNDGHPVLVEHLFRGIENGTYKVGINGVDFGMYYRYYLPEWWENVYRRTLNDFQSYIVDRQVQNILITGGGLEMMRPVLENQIKKGTALGKMLVLSEQPLVDNVLGIWYYATNS